MRTSRMLLRLLVLVGCLILLLDVRYRGFATWAAVCGVYKTTYKTCPKPCTDNYFTSSKTQDGPYYISSTNYPWCTGDPEHDCSAGTEVISDSLPQEDTTLCGCGATGQYCDIGGPCCGSDLCQLVEGQNYGSCVICLANGWTCDYNSECCSEYCDGKCCSSYLGGACGTPADCCNLDAECPHGLCCLPTGADCSGNEGACCPGGHCQDGTCECNMQTPVAAGILHLPWL